MDTIAQFIPYIAAGGVVIFMPPAFRRLFRNVARIEADEVAQGRKDWYPDHEGGVR